MLSKEGRTLDLDRPNNYVKLVNRTFLNYLLFEHRDGPIFDWTATMTFKALEDETETLGSASGTGKAAITPTGLKT